jgi:hypothetical protein
VASSILFQSSNLWLNGNSVWMPGMLPGMMPMRARALALRIGIRSCATAASCHDHLGLSH